jgi:transmembrane sensor
MNAGDRDKSAAQLKRDARRWVEQLVSGEATAVDFEAAQRWRRRSPDHEAAFAEATRLWRNFGPAARELLAVEGPPAWPRTSWKSSQSVMNRRAVLGAAGASMAAVAAYAVIDPRLGFWESFRELRADYRTATGQQRSLTLADNVSVQMNTQTSIAIPAADENDKIKLIAGQAAFAIPPQATKPLVVLADSGRTIAKAARFEVRNTDASVCVTCFEGEIEVEQERQARTIGMNQMVRYDRKGIGEVAAINPVEALAWQHGVLIFRATPLSDVIVEINRYRPGRIILLNSALRTKTISGRFEVARIDDVLVWIGGIVGAKSRTLPGGIVLLS